MEVCVTVETTLWFEVDDSKDVDGLLEELEGKTISEIHAEYEVSAYDESLIGVTET